MALTLSQLGRADSDDTDSLPGLTLQRRLKKVLAQSYLAGVKGTDSEGLRKLYPNVETNWAGTFTTVVLSNASEYCFVYIDDDTLDISVKSHCKPKKVGGS